MIMVTKILAEQLSGVDDVLASVRVLLVPIALLLCSTSLLAQGRTLDELKNEVQSRSERQAYPCEGLKPDDVHEALIRLSSLAPNEWADVWSSIGDRYMDRGRISSQSSPGEADKDFLQAWIYYNFARWPAPTSSGKQLAYQKALDAYRAHARFLRPSLEIVKIPFENTAIRAYIQMPEKTPAPIVIVIPGLDRGKENMAESVRSIVDSGIGYLAVDAPGTGEAPIKAGPEAGRMLVKAIEYVLQRPDVDKARVAVYGVSFGGFWATELAATEKDHLRAVIAQSPPLHDAFDRAKTMNMTNNREFLFDYLQAYLYMFGAATETDLADAREKMAIVSQGFLEKPMAPLLVIAGVRDTQVPISDVDLLLNSGQTPREAWINPLGGHMGRDKEWSSVRLFNAVVLPWLLKNLRGS